MTGISFADISWTFFHPRSSTGGYTLNERFAHSLLSKECLEFERWVTILVTEFRVSCNDDLIEWLMDSLWYLFTLFCRFCYFINTRPVKTAILKVTQGKKKWLKRSSRSNVMNLNDRESQVKAPDHLHCATSSSSSASLPLSFGGTCFGEFFHCLRFWWSSLTIA